MSNFLLNINNLLIDNTNNKQLIILINNLLESFKKISSDMRDDKYLSSNVGTNNSFGDQQLDIDIKTNNIIFESLKKSNVVHIGSSEETPIEVDCNPSNDLEKDKGFSVAFDPLDGSSIIDCNFAVGTICGIWEGCGIKNKKCSDMVCSMISVYGPKTTLIIAFDKRLTKSNEYKCLELVFKENVWIITEESIQLKNEGKIFAPGNYSAVNKNENYKKVVDYWMKNNYKLRYSGGLVPDIYHILVKRKGIFTYFSNKSQNAKLRLIYEILPISLIVNACNGKSLICSNEDGHCEISPDKIIDDLGETVNVCYGSKDEVEKFKEIYYEVN